MMGQSEILSSSHINLYLLQSFLQVHTVAVPFTNHRKLWDYAEPKPFSSPKPVYFDFSSSNFTVQDHILSTAGDAFSEGKKKLSTQKLSKLSKIIQN
jgi:hypothetical protein